jgi:hypothetical protein
MARNDSTTPERRSPKEQGCHTRKIKVNQIHYLRKLKDDPVGAGLDSAQGLLAATSGI